MCGVHFSIISLNYQSSRAGLYPTDPCPVLLQDKLTLYHWRRAADEGKEYPFVQFNKSVDVPTYTKEEYTVSTCVMYVLIIMCSSWEKHMLVMWALCNCHVICLEASHRRVLVKRGNRPPVWVMQVRNVTLASLVFSFSDTLSSTLSLMVCVQEVWTPLYHSPGQIWLQQVHSELSVNQPLTCTPTCITWQPVSLYAILP